MSTLARIPRLFGVIEPKPVAANLPPADTYRPRLMSQIITINPTATAAFLERFGTRELESYLKHLSSAQQPRGGNARWVRPNDAKGIVWDDATA